MAQRVLAAVLRLAFRRRVFVLLVLMAIAALSGRQLTRVTFDSNVLHLLPQQGTAVQAFRSYLDAFGNLDRLYVMFEAPPDHDIAEYDDVISRYLEQLRSLAEIDYVDAGTDDPGKDWSYLADRQLLVLGSAHVGDALARFAPDALDSALVDARERLTVSSSALKGLIQQDPLGLLMLVRDRMSADGVPLLVDPSQRGYVSSDGRSRLVIAKPVRPPHDTVFARQLNDRLDVLRLAARSAPDPPGSVPANPLPPLVIKEAGGYRIAAETEALIRGESIVNSATSFVCILLLVLIVFRSTRPLVAVSLPIVLAALVTLAIYGAFHALSTAAAGSAAILFGLGVDGTVLLYFSYLQQRSRGADPESAVVGLSGPAVSMVIGFTTTAATYFGLVPVDLPALGELGRIIGLGVLVCGAAAIVMVPALVPRQDGPVQARNFQTPWLPQFVDRFRTGILIVAALVTVVLGVASRHLRVVPTIQKLESHTPGSDVERDIMRRFNLPEDALFVVAEGDSLDALLQAHQRLAEELAGAGPGVTVSSPVMFLPTAAEQQRTADLVAHAGIDPKRFVDALNIAGAKAGFRPGSFAPFVARLPRLLDAEERLTLDGYRAHGLTDIISRYVVMRGGRYSTVAYVYARSADQRDRVQALVQRIGPPLRLTGVTIVNRELEDRFLPAFLRGAAIGTVGVALLLLVGFWSVRLMLLAFLPTALGIVWSVGLLALAGVELDLISVFALLSSIGIGVDYAVYLLHRRSTEVSGGMTGALTNTAPVILFAGGATVIGFGSLMMSSYGPLRALGLVTTTTIVGCLIASLLVLPALLKDRP